MLCGSFLVWTHFCRRQSRKIPAGDVFSSDFWFLKRRLAGVKGGYNKKETDLR